ncbi:hypothetical protein FT663_01157 [Candidozyma haemuli var. vulneris]|uniref:Elongator complex protein 4 n=1 Tax=Candidozyma haemuli TaxID=45357 RepID=A0A2V1AWR4_9ASCO|nr:hypothetical protein CXQ85_004906 [[Candida] haemuloni]KAF3992320.1 hypothetical protein FT662_01192 [[Candida] haemuloni var. vulneris]KAF3994690.1 hypothetical protein FT663_01157 [[Candida] haemuloni var. vulneris]PVH22234.1 hypothetical protein CXQ85_004906 [[Candida] haemuloni]
MSFRKRSEPLVPGRGIPRGSPTVPGRAPLAGRAPPGAALGRVPAAATPKKPETRDIIAENPGVRPSVSNSEPTVSTGCPDLDKLLIHSGLPLGHSLIVEESGTTDYSSVLLRAFAAQGIIHSRLEKGKDHCHVIAIGVPAAWANNLPGVYKGSSKDQKKARIAADSSKVSVSNMADKDLKIAWRYGLKNQNNPEEEPETPDSHLENYTTQFDITQRLIPGASPQEISFVPLSNHFQSVVAQIKSIIQSQLENSPSKVIRLVMPSFLNPSLYPPQASASTFIIPFFHSLQSLLRQYQSNVALIASLPLDLYPRGSVLTQFFESLADGVVHLQPFNRDMELLIEKAYKNEPSKIQQGFVNIIKVPILSAKGMMMIRNGEYAFKNGRKNFEIEEWGIPVEDDTPDDQQQTTQNVDF